MSYLANTGKSLDILPRFETTFSRAFDRAQKALGKMQKVRTQSTTTEELRIEPAAEPEASAPNNENCGTNPTPQPPHPDYEANGPIPGPALLRNEPGPAQFSDVVL